MKRQTLKIGSALLATTALSSMASAGTIETSGLANVTTFNVPKLAAQVFPATGASSIAIGPTNFQIDFTNSLSATFDVTLNVAGANVTAGTLGSVFIQSGAASLGYSVQATAGCAVQILTDRILLSDCNPSGDNSVDAIQLSGVTFNTANGLATAGSSITVSGLVVASASQTTFETIASTAIITSVNGLTGSGAAATAVSISNTATPAFTKLTGNATSLVLGTAAVKQTSSVTNAALVDIAASATSTLTSAVNLKVTHGVLTDAATTKLQISLQGATSVASFTPTTTAGNIASFNLTAEAALTGTYDITVTFNGTTAISEWSAGTTDITFSKGTVGVKANPAGTGSLVGLTRGGFSTQVNTAQSTFGEGSTFYRSFVRITNNGLIPGAATIVVKNDATGVLIGTYTTASIASKSTLQVGMAEIEAVVGSPTANIRYRLEISGPITGYIQHVMWNSVDNLFVDLSGSRQGSGSAP